LILSGFTLLTLFRDGFWRRRGWLNFHDTWVSREDSPELYWFVVLCLQVFTVGSPFLHRNGHTPAPELSAFSPLLGPLLLSSAAVGTLALAWYLIPISIACQYPRVAFLFDRDFYLFCLFGLFAKLAKADGVVSPEEIREMVDLMNNSLRLSKRETQIAQGVFLHMKVTPYPTEQITRLCLARFGDEPGILLSMVDALIWLALADRKLHPAEDLLIRNIVSAFGIPESRYQTLRDKHLREAGMAAEEEPEPKQEWKKPKGRTAAPKSIPKAYLVLESVPEDSWEKIKANYQRLIKENHPDILASKKLPKQLLERASRRTQEIIEAYDELRKSRGVH